jgi:PAS domain S-box-containing protein
VTIDSDSQRFSKALKAAIFLPVGTIFIAAFILLLFIFMLLDVIKWSDHSYRVITHTRSCENRVVNMQNNVTGYLLTGDKSFLDDFAKDEAEQGTAFIELRDLVRDNPEQVLKADDLLRSKETWLQNARESLRQKLAGSVVGNALALNGRNLMEALMVRFEAFNGAEEKLRVQRAGRVRRMKEALAYACGGLVLLLSFTVGLQVRRQFLLLASDYRMALSTIEQRHQELLRSEADLEDQKEWFRVTLASIGDGVIVTDEEGRVIMLNQEAERLTGWTGIDALLKPLPTVFRIINEESRHPVEDPVTKVFREKKVVGLANHTVLLSRQGAEWPIEDSAAPIHDAKGKVLGVVLVFHNATEMRRAQHTLKAYSEDLEKKVVERTTTLQQAVLELEAFSYTVSHDLRSPLRAMQGFAQAVIEDFGDKLDEQGKSYLNRIKNAAERLDRLIQDLLSYTRISRDETRLVSLDLDKMVREIVEHYPNLHPPATQVRIEGTLPKILGKEAALTQVLSNLLGNAAKFVPGGTVPQIRVWHEDLGAHIRLWIEDNGIGIAPRDRERIFEMFVQVNESQLYGGTGVGLAIVKKAVQTMDGAVGVESSEGAGSRFWVELTKATS